MNYTNLALIKSSNCPEISKFWGLVEYKPQWSLTIEAWLIILLVITIIIGAVIRTIQPFLAVYKPLEADTLIVEGWISDELVKQAMVEFEQGNYQLLITTGSPLSKGHFLSKYENFAELTAATLISLGFEQNKLVVIPCPGVELNRTYSAAIAVREWLLTSKHRVKVINLFSYDVHTRRSWIIYRRTLSPKYKIGAIASTTNMYKSEKWWQSSAGFRFVFGEAIAYIYVKLFERLSIKV